MEKWMEWAKKLSFNTVAPCDTNMVKLMAEVWEITDTLGLQYFNLSVSVCAC